jgi:hypothetical protein
METLSKVALANDDVLRLLTAKPTYTLGAMTTVWLVPNCVHVVPLLEPYMVKTFPLRTSFSQFGGVALPTDWYVLLEPVLVLSVANTEGT